MGGALEESYAQHGRFAVGSKTEDRAFLPQALEVGSALHTTNFCRSYHLAGACAVPSGCTWAGALRSAEGVRLSRCTFCVAGACGVCESAAQMRLYLFQVRSAVLSGRGGVLFHAHKGNRRSPTRPGPTRSRNAARGHTELPRAPQFRVAGVRF